jgi:hypothetical protein
MGSEVERAPMATIGAENGTYPRGHPEAAGIIISLSCGIHLNPLPFCACQQEELSTKPGAWEGEHTRW